MAALRTPVSKEQLNKGNIFLSLFENVQKLEESDTYKALYVPTSQEFRLTAVDVRNGNLHHMIRKQATLQKTQHAHVVRHVTNFFTRKYHEVDDKLECSETGEVECLWVQTELLENTLESCKIGGNLKDDCVLPVLDQTSRTLEHCHSMRLLHGGIKDSAVFVCEENGDRVYKLGQFDPLLTAPEGNPFSPAEDMADLGKMLRAVSSPTSPIAPVLDGLETGRYSSVADLRSSREFRALYSHSGFSDDCLPGMMATFRDVMQDHLIPDQLMTKMPMFRALRDREAIEAEKVPQKQRLMFLSALEESRMGGRLQQFLGALKETGCYQLYKLLTGELFKEQCAENEEAFKLYRRDLEEKIVSIDLVTSLVDLRCLHWIDKEEIQTKRDTKGNFEGMKLLLDRLYQKNPLTSARDILEAVHKVDPSAVKLLDPQFQPKKQREANRSRATAGPAVARGSSQSQSRSETPVSSSQAFASHVRSSSAHSVPTASSAASPLASSSKSEKDSVPKQDCLRVLKENGGWMIAKDIAKKLGLSGGRSTVNSQLSALVKDGSVKKDDKINPPRYQRVVDN